MTKCSAVEVFSIYIPLANHWAEELYPSTLLKKGLTHHFGKMFSRCFAERRLRAAPGLADSCPGKQRAWRQRRPLLRFWHLGAWMFIVPFPQQTPPKKKEGSK